MNTNKTYLDYFGINYLIATAKWAIKSVLPISLSSLENKVLIGSGAFGDVYKADYNGVTYALKVFKKRGMALIESEKMKWLPNDPRFPQVFFADDFHILMTYMGDMNLDFLRDPSNANLQQRISVMLNLSRGLDFLHRHGILHGDLKKENIILKPDFNIRLIDFTFSRKTYDLQLVKHGTLLYFAPETALNHLVTQKSEIYSLGLIFWEFLSCEEVYAEVKSVNTFYKKIEMHQMPSNQALRFQNPTLILLIAQMWCLNPEERFSLPCVISILSSMNSNYSYPNTVNQVALFHNQFRPLAKYLVGAVRDNNFEIARLIVEGSLDPRKEITELLAEKTSALTAAVLLKRPGFIEYFMRYIQAGTSFQYPSKRHFLYDLAVSGAWRELRDLLSSQNLTESLYETLFPEQAQLIQWWPSSSDQPSMEQRRVMNLIIEHPFFSIKHLRMLKAYDSQQRVFFPGVLTSRLGGVLQILTPEIEVDFFNLLESTPAKTKVLDFFLKIKSVHPQWQQIIDAINQLLFVPKQLTEFEPHHPTKCQRKTALNTLQHEVRALMLMSERLIFFPKFYGLFENNPILARKELRLLLPYLLDVKPDLLKRIQVIKNFAMALKSLHDVGIIHNNIVLDKMMVTQEGTPHLHDYAHAVINGAKSSQVHYQFHHFAPELFQGMASEQSDVFAFAILAWSILANKKYESADSFSAAQRAVTDNKQRPKLADLVFPHTVLALMLFQLWRQNPLDRMNLATAMTLISEVQKSKDLSSCDLGDALKWQTKQLGSLVGLFNAARVDGNLEMVQWVMQSTHFNQSKMLPCTPCPNHEDSVEIKRLLSF